MASRRAGARQRVPSSWIPMARRSWLDRIGLRDLWNALRQALLFARYLIVFVRIPTMVEAGKNDKRAEEDLDFNSTLRDLRANLDSPVDAQKLDLHMGAQVGARPVNSDTPPVLEDSPFALDALIPDTSDRVR